MRQLSILTRAQGATRPLIEGAVTVPGYELSFVDEPVLVRGFRKMVRALEYDVAEMALTTYLTAREHGVAFTALPVFLVRNFHHGATQVLRDGHVRRPSDLTNGLVGVNRGYTVTTGVWGRAVLAENGLDLDSVTWVLSGDEHVASYVAPANVVRAPEGRSMEELLLAGELDAVVGAAIDHPDVVPVIAEPEDAGMAMLREHGVFPINHLLVVRDDLLEQCPDVSVALFHAFADAKQRYVQRLREGVVADDQDRLLRRVMAEADIDPLPYGVAPNCLVLEELLDHARAQHILKRSTDLESLFAANTLNLQG